MPQSGALCWQHLLQAGAGWPQGGSRECGAITRTEDRAAGGAAGLPVHWGGQGGGGGGGGVPSPSQEPGGGCPGGGAGGLAGQDGGGSGQGEEWTGQELPGGL